MHKFNERNKKSSLGISKKHCSNQLCAKHVPLSVTATTIPTVIRILYQKSSSPHFDSHLRFQTQVALNHTDPKEKTIFFDHCLILWWFPIWQFSHTGPQIGKPVKKEKKKPFFFCRFSEHYVNKNKFKGTSEKIDMIVTTKPQAK